MTGGLIPPEENQALRQHRPSTDGAGVLPAPEVRGLVSGEAPQTQNTTQVEIRYEGIQNFRKKITLLNAVIESLEKGEEVYELLETLASEYTDEVKDWVTDNFRVNNPCEGCYDNYDIDWVE